MKRQLIENLKSGYIKKSYPVQTKRYCQFLKLKLDEDKVEQYKYWHKSQNIWPEIPEGIRKAGILDMEIYLIGNVEFMIVETPIDFNWDDAFGRLATYERQSEWEEFMSQFQDVEHGNTSDEKWQLMERIFSLEDCLKIK